MLERGWTEQLDPKTLYGYSEDFLRVSCVSASPQDPPVTSSDHVVVWNSECVGSDHSEPFWSKLDLRSLDEVELSWLVVFSENCIFKHVPCNLRRTAVHCSPPFLWLESVDQPRQAISISVTLKKPGATRHGTVHGLNMGSWSHNNVCWIPVCTYMHIDV